MISIVIFSIWKFSGLHFLYYLIGFENIPVTYYEAARIDGAGEWTLFRKIILPLLTPSIFYVLLTTMIGTMQAFDEPYFLTHGGQLPCLFMRKLSNLMIWDMHPVWQHFYLLRYLF